MDDARAIEVLRLAIRKMPREWQEHRALDHIAERLAALEAAREDAAEAKQNGYELGLLAAAREDAERFAWYFDAERDGDGALVSLHLRVLDGDKPTVDDWRAAIDQARGKGGQEVGNG